jgi:hypothetical protein
MKAWIPLMLVFALGSAAHSQATCTYPASPDAPPDGATATKEQMIAAKHAFDHYNSEMNAYLDCIKLEMDSAVPKDKSKLSPEEKKKVEEHEKVLVQKNNAAVDELQANVGKFNDQLKAYKAAQAVK